MVTFFIPTLLLAFVVIIVQLFGLTEGSISYMFPSEALSSSTYTITGSSIDAGTYYTSESTNPYSSGAEKAFDKSTSTHYHSINAAYQSIIGSYI